MKILIIHYRFFETGGPERYLFNITEQLKKKGHELIHFSVKHNKNRDSKYSNYFISSIGNGNITYSNQVKFNLVDLTKSINRHFFSFEAKSKLEKLIEETKPDIAYILQYQSKMSPSILWSLKKFDIPVVQRISDYNHFCANNLFYNFKTNKPCTKCLNNSLLPGIKNKCVEGSAAKSLIRISAMWLHNILKVRNKIDRFVIPSKFTLNKFIQSGESREKLIHIPTFFNSSIKTKNITYTNFALYVGRFDEDKGIRTLIKAFVSSKRPLIVIGDSSSNLARELINKANTEKHNIKFLGKLPFNEVSHYLSECLFTICPSIWYENFPNTILESFAHKKAVVASNIGSLSELVFPKKNGLLFKPKDDKDLQDKCEMLFNDTQLTESMGRMAYDYLNTHFSMKGHLIKLISLFDDIVNNHQKKCNESR